MESRRLNFEGHDAHYWRGGAGFPVLMIHGVGPGTSVLGNFGPALEALSEECEIFAMDLVGFGGSSRRSEPPYFDIDLWIRQGEAMLSLMPEGVVGVAGHSMGGAIALKLAARTSRIVKVLTSCTVGAPYSLNAALGGFWSAPEDRAGLRRAMTRMMYSADDVTDAMVEDRWSFLSAPGYAAYMQTMFSEPKQRLLDAAVLQDEELARIRAEIVMLHGRDDQPCPPEETTLPLARKLPAADVRLFGRCGHNLPRERTADYVDCFKKLFGGSTG